MKDDFDTWNAIKKDISEESSVNRRNIPRREDVWVSILGKNIGFEQNGIGDYFLRPVLIVKKFNNKMFWVVPLSRKQKDLDFYVNYTDQSGREVSAIVSQLKLISINRFKRKLYTIESEVFTQVINKIIYLLLQNIENPRLSGFSRCLSALCDNSLSKPRDLSNSTLT